MDSMDSENDEDLIFYMSCRVDDLATARAAFEEFYNRHYEDVYRKIYRWVVNRSPLTEDDARSIIVDAFRDLFEYKAQKYVPVGGTDKQMTSNVKAWFMRIVKNNVIDHFRTEQPMYGKVVSIDSMQGFDLPDVESEFELTAFEDKVQHMGQILDTLSERDRLIAMTIVSVVDLETGQQRRMSRDELESIADKIGTTSDYIRQLRKRLIERIKKEFEIDGRHEVNVVKIGAKS